MSERSVDLLFADILQCADKIIDYTANLSFEEFARDGKTVDAVIRNFEIIGEASHRLPEEIKELFTSVDWYMVRGFRNRIVHDYFGIDYTIVWEIKESYLPVLIEELTQILKKIK